MKLKKISCTQFAGVRDRDITLNDGINVIFGKNESGKSTLVNLISRTLFQNARIDNRRDKEFKELYFPGARKGSSIVGDFADGKLTFETEKGTYTLTKEWGSDSRCTLSTPDGIIRDADTIEEILREALVYGEGVYAEMLFSSQRNTDFALQTILDSTGKTDTKKELTDAVSMAFREGDGVSTDAIGQAIDARIDDIMGKHWDIERSIPVRKAGRWVNGLGEILKAYYALEDAKEVLETISELERESDIATSDYTAKDLAVADIEKTCNEFRKLQGQIKARKFNSDTKTRLDAELQKIADILLIWPKLSENLAKARGLQTEKANRELMDKFEAASKIMAEIDGDSAEIAKLPCPTGAEIMQVKTAYKGVTTLENKLCGMNINAAINMLGGNNVEVISLRSGEPIDISGGTAAITEAVKITVPGVMEMQLSPANVDVSAIEAEIAEQQKVINRNLVRYKVETLEALEKLEKDISDAKTKAEMATTHLTAILGDITFEELKAKVPSSARPSDDIERDIIAVCGSDDIVRFINSTETKIEGYTSEYISIDNLKKIATEKQAEYDKAAEALKSADDIPTEFLTVSDPDTYLAGLESDLEDKRIAREDALTRKANATSRLETYKENLTTDPKEDKDRAERAFKEVKELLDHWLHIKEVFLTEKQNVHDNPMQDIADSFLHYLGIISDGKISSEFPEAEKLNMNIYSGNSLLDYGKLSEGTKETVSLAFRLAVLDHLFPVGGGVIVFDDPLTDMDADRVEQSCTLINECAKRHQVIFLTCREDYIDMLSGNVIRF